MSQFRDTKLLQKVGVQLKILRGDDRTQLDVLHDTGIHVGRIETAKKNLTLSTLSKLCKYYDVTLTKFMSSVEDSK
jgi:transcriptional regulator with XRE-family HTH domain